jgi:hypothetical protein
MNIEIGYELMYDYWKESYGQGSWQTNTSFQRFLPWDGSKSFEDLVRQRHPDFVTLSEESQSDKNHRIEVTCLRIGGEKSNVILRVEKQVIHLRAVAVEA